MKGSPLSLKPAGPLGSSGSHCSKTLGAKRAREQRGGGLALGARAENNKCARFAGLKPRNAGCCPASGPPLQASPNTSGLSDIPTAWE